MLEKVVTEITISEDLMLGQSKIKLLAYADDITILGNNIERMKKHCKKLINGTSKIGLIINYKKKQNTSNLAEKIECINMRRV